MLVSINWLILLSIHCLLLLSIHWDNCSATEVQGVWCTCPDISYYLISCSKLSAFHIKLWLSIVFSHYPECTTTNFMDASEVSRELVFLDEISLVFSFQFWILLLFSFLKLDWVLHSQKTDHYYSYFSRMGVWNAFLLPVKDSVLFNFNNKGFHCLWLVSL